MEGQVGALGGDGVRGLVESSANLRCPRRSERCFWVARFLGTLGPGVRLGGF